MNAAQDEARSVRLRARMNPTAGTIGATDDEKPCECAPSVGWKTGLFFGALVAGTAGILIGGTLADEAHSRKKR